MLKNTLFSALAFIFLAAISQTYAASPIMHIAPTMPRNGTPILLPSQATTAVDFTVTNATNSQTLTSLTVYPAFNLSQKAASAITLTSNTCTSALTPGASCHFQITLTGNINLPSQFALSPRVCAYNGAVCSQPVLADRVLVNASQYYTRAYIAAANATAIYGCTIVGDGNFSNCTLLEPDTLGDVNTGLAFSRDQTRAFILKDNTPTRLIVCVVNADGSLNPCAANPTQVTERSTPRSIVLNAAGTRAYITNNYNGVLGQYSIAQCDVTGGVLANCAGTGFQDEESYGITLNQANTLAYITGLASNKLYVCDINALNGNLENCTEQAAAGVTAPTGIALNAAETGLYITRGQAAPNGSVYFCAVDASGDVPAACTQMSIPGLDNPRGIFIDNIRNLVYISNTSGAQDVMKCQIASNGALVNCTAASGMLNTPIGIVLL